MSTQPQDHRLHNNNASSYVVGCSYVYNIQNWVCHLIHKVRETETQFLRSDVYNKYAIWQYDGTGPGQNIREREAWIRKQKSAFSTYSLLAFSTYCDDIMYIVHCTLAVKLADNKYCRAIPDMCFMSIYG